ncbi:MAG: hypothetical protein LV477_06825 [Candidatus Nitrosotalea sp.]|nr:hypothetical protein [Candidatus Nitrosotalea sp.]
MDKTINLIILEAYARDVGRGVARIDHKSMEALGASIGDILEITGKKRSVARCLPLYPTDEGKQTIRIDGIGRNNTGANIGDNLTIRKIKTVPAEKITVVPLDSIPSLDERYLADALNGMPVTKNDNVLIPYFGGRLAFQIVAITPDTDVIVDQKTLFTITKKATGCVMFPVVSIHHENVHNSDTLKRLKLDIEQYEKEISEKQEEIKNISRKMMQENHKVSDIKKFINSNRNESLISTFQQLLNVYRKYVAELEATTSKK